MTSWHKASRVELVAEIDRLTQANTEIRAELALRDSTDEIVTVVGRHMMKSAFGD